MCVCVLHHGGITTSMVTLNSLLQFLYLFCKLDTAKGAVMCVCVCVTLNSLLQVLLAVQSDA